VFAGKTLWAGFINRLLVLAEYSRSGTILNIAVFLPGKVGVKYGLLCVPAFL